MLEPIACRGSSGYSSGGGASKSQTTHFLPFDPPGPMIGDWELGTEYSKHILKVSTPNWSALATIVGSLNYIRDIGVEESVATAIRCKRLQESFRSTGFERLHHRNSKAPYVVFSSEGVGHVFRNALKEGENIRHSLQETKFDIPPTV